MRRDAAIRQRGYALVVEGYMDVVALAQSGFGNAVATLGTACTAEHVQKLFRFTDSVVFSFDGDAAGRRAAGRALEASLPHASDTRTVRFLFLPVADAAAGMFFVGLLAAPAPLVLVAHGIYLAGWHLTGRILAWPLVAMWALVAVVALAFGNQPPKPVSGR